jgi:hypothetical protein
MRSSGTALTNMAKCRCWSRMSAREQDAVCAPSAPSAVTQPRSCVVNRKVRRSCESDSHELLSTDATWYADGRNQKHRHWGRCLVASIASCGAYLYPGRLHISSSNSVRSAALPATTAASSNGISIFGWGQLFHRVELPLVCGMLDRFDDQLAEFFPRIIDALSITVPSNEWWRSCIGLCSTCGARACDAKNLVTKWLMRPPAGSAPSRSQSNLTIMANAAPSCAGRKREQTLERRVK